MHGRDGADAQGVAPAAPYGHPLVERGALGGLQLGGAEEVGDLAGMSRATGSSGAGVSSSMAVWSGRRSATAVRIAPRLTQWSRASAAMERPSRYAMRTAVVLSGATAGRRV